MVFLTLTRQIGLIFRTKIYENPTLISFGMSHFEATAHLAAIPKLGIVHSHVGNASFPRKEYQ